jgi:hypothetical protein
MIDSNRFYVRGLIEIPIHLQQSSELMESGSSPNSTVSSSNSNGSSSSSSSSSSSNNPNCNNSNNISSSNGNASEITLSTSHSGSQSGEGDSESTSGGPSDLSISTTSEHGPPRLIWGIWVQVAATDFYRILSNWNKSDVGDVLEGEMNSNLPCYKHSTLNLKLRLHTRPDGLRPYVEVISPHQLQDEAEKGVELSRLEEILDYSIGKGDVGLGVASPRAQDQNQPRSFKGSRRPRPSNNGPTKVSQD